MIYGIGDIHGQMDQLNDALALIAADGGADADIVFMGDYTDRGLHSREVIDFLIAGRDAGRPWTFIKGNHDRMFTRFVADGTSHDDLIPPGLHWLNPRLGGTNTLVSYGIKGEMLFAPHTRGDLEQLVSWNGLPFPALLEAVQDAVPQSHIDFLENAKLMHATDDLTFVHAGIRPGVALSDQTENDLLWIRDGFLEDTTDHGPIVVHGHTAIDAPEHYGNRINIDAGAGRGRILTPVVFEGRDCWVLTADGRKPLLPPQA